MSYPHGMYTNSNASTNPHLPVSSTMTRVRSRPHDWSQDVIDPHERDRDHPAKRVRTAVGVPPGPYPINPPPGMLRPSFNAGAYHSQLGPPSQVSLQSQSQQMFGKQQVPPPHLQPHNHLHPHPPVPFHQRPNIAAPHSALTIPPAPQSQYPFPVAKPSFPRAPPSLTQLSADRLPPPPRKNPAAHSHGPGMNAAISTTVGDVEGRPNGNDGPDMEASGLGRRADAPDSFKDFLAKQPDTISPAAAKDAYDQYVRDFTKRSPNSFFDLHMHEEWFRERYDPDYVFSRVQRIKRECQDRSSDFKNLWDRGGSSVCAPDISSAVLSSGDDGTKEKSGLDGPEGGKSGEGHNGDGDRESDLAVDSVQDISMKNSFDSVSHHGPIESMDEVSANEPAEGRDLDDGKGKQKDEPTIVPKEEDNDCITESKQELLKEEWKGELKEELKGEIKCEIKGEIKGELKGEIKGELKGELKKELKEEMKEDGSDSIDGARVSSAIESVEAADMNPSKKSSAGEFSASQDKSNEEVKVDCSDENTAADNIDHDEESTREQIESHGRPVQASDENIDGKHSDSAGKYDSTSDLVLPLRREHEKNTIFLRGIPINLARDDLTKVLAHGSTGKLDLQLRRVKIGDINPTRNLQRFAWAVYADEASASRALSLVKGVRVKTKTKKAKYAENASDSDGDQNMMDGEKDPTAEYVIDCMINLERKKKYTHGRVLPDGFGTVLRMGHDLKNALELMQCLDKARELDSKINPLTDDYLSTLLSDGRRLDHVITYLREVHYYCYYSGNEFLEDATSMPPQELRPILNDNNSKSEADMRMLKRVDERTKWVLERDYDRPRSNSDHAEKEKEEAIEKWLNANTINEGQGRYRCNLPPHKLFKAPEFVHKHLKTRHADRMKIVVEKALEDVYRRNFENDPSKEEVIEFYNEGMSGSNDRGSSNQRRPTNFPGNRETTGFPTMNSMSTRPNIPPGMFNPPQPYVGLGMPQMPMMMMPPSGFSYPNAMQFGRGMNSAAVGGNMRPVDIGGGAMMPTGGAGLVGKDVAGSGRGLWQGTGSLGDEGNRGVPRIGLTPGPKGVGMPIGSGTEQMMRGTSIGGGGGANRGGGGPHGGHSGRGGGGYDGGSRSNQYHRGGRRGGRRGRHDHGEALDPRAMGPRRNYTDLDAPAKGPSFDLVRYDDV